MLPAARMVYIVLVVTIKMIASEHFLVETKDKHGLSKSHSKHLDVMDANIGWRDMFKEHGENYADHSEADTKRTKFDDVQGIDKNAKNKCSLITHLS